MSSFHERKILLLLTVCSGIIQIFYAKCFYYKHSFIACRVFIHQAVESKRSDLNHSVLSVAWTHLPKTMPLFRVSN